MSEADPLRAPRRERSPREDEARGDGAALGLVVALALCVLGAIWYVHEFPIGGDVAPAGTVLADGSVADGSGGVGGPGMGTRREMQELPLEQAPRFQNDVIGRTVTHVTESDACKSLRLARDRLRENLRRPAQASSSDLQREMDTVMSQGTERGCWSGGTG